LRGRRKTAHGGAGSGRQQRRAGGRAGGRAGARAGGRARERARAFHSPSCRWLVCDTYVPCPLMRPLRHSPSYIEPSGQAQVPTPSGTPKRRVP